MEERSSNLGAWIAALRERDPDASLKDTLDAIDRDALDNGVRRNPLLYFERAGRRYVIGSKGGDDRHPEWYLNLRDEPAVHVRVMADVYEADARTLAAAEREALWPDLVARYPMFDEYQAETERPIPVVELVPRTGPGT